MKKTMLIILSVVLALCGAAEASFTEVLALTPPTESSCVSVEIEATSASPIMGLRWFHNDENHQFPRVVLVEGEAGEAPDLSDPGLILLEVNAESMGWGQVDFGGAIHSSTGIAHAVFYFPSNIATTAAGEGGGPGIGVRVAENAVPFFVSGDGSSWARFDEQYEIGIEPVRGLMKGGASRVLSEMGGQALLIGEDEADAPVIVRTILEKPYPNPFNPRVTISYSLGTQGQMSLEIYDVKGRLVATLVDGIQSAGRYSMTWDGTDQGGKSVASGVYFARFSSAETTMSHRMVLVR